jgi:hypothetical protein
MPKTLYAILVALIAAMLCGATAANARFGSFNVPGVGHVDLSHPLHPVTPAPIKIPGVGTVTPPAPNPIPSTPSVQLDSHIPGASLFNEIDDTLHAPEQLAQKSLDAVGSGIQHLGNEIGMLWAHAKQKVEETIQGWIDWLIAQLKHYGALAVVAVFGAMMLSSAIVVYLPRAVATMLPRGRRAPKRKLRHA